MKQSQLLGWLKKAYPEIRSVKKENGDVWLSNDQYLQIVARLDNIVEFHKLAGRDLKNPIPIEDESQIIKSIRDLWGEPKVAFTTGESKQPKEEKKSPEEPQREQPKKQAQYGKESVIKQLKSIFSDLLEISKVPGGKAVVINGSKLILYDLGISSKPSEFIPWARTEDVEKCIDKFISINK